MDPAASTPPAGPTPPDSSPAKAAPGKPKRRLLRKLGILAVALLVFGAAGLGGAEYYTSRPNFCGTCHVMDPYYLSWSHDKHSGQANVWCVECHYAPGEQHTVMAKFRGLSQLASYFSGRYGAGRPRAHVNDASCLRSGCHGEGAHLAKKLPLGKSGMEKRIVSGVETEIERVPTVMFDHSKHLKVADRLAETDAAIAAVTKQVSQKAGGPAMAELRRLVSSIRPASERGASLAEAIKRLGLGDVEADAKNWMRLEHERLRLLQLDGINCAACHTYDASGANHFAVDRQSCFVCHFTNQAFNEGTGACLKCHEPPTRKIFVHGASSAHAQATGATQPSGGDLMDHRDIVKRGINCESCHADVVRGAPTVSVRDCTHCHDQGRFTQGFEERSTETVADYHRAHVAANRARCADCHKSVEHSLVDPTHVGTSAGFLSPVINDCQHCHPNHHHEQVQLLMGTGGAGIDQNMPNSMFGSRLNCRACHNQSGSDFKGAPLIEASQSACAACHGDDYRKLFDQQMAELKTYLDETNAALTRADAAVKGARNAGREIPEAIAKQIERARANYQFIHAGNGIHNKNYSLQVLDLCQRDLDAAIMSLGPK